MRYFLAGGAVRDLLLGRNPIEFDIVFDGSREETDHLCSKAPRVGKTAATFIINGHEHMPLMGGIQEDLLLRDCTMNALLLDEEGRIHALPRTFADLRDGIIRAVSPTAFSHDPVRVFRAARFAAVLPEFNIEPETLSFMRETAANPAFKVIAAERVGKECMKAMAGHAPGTFIRALARAGALVPWFSPLENGTAIPAGPAVFHGDGTVIDHMTAVMDAIAALPRTRGLDGQGRALAVWMGLCHDLGKLTTPADMLPRHIGHDSRGGVLAGELASRLRLPKLWEKAGRLAALLHMKAGNYLSLRPGTRVDMLHKLAAGRLFAPFTVLVAADSGDERIADRMCRDMDAILAVHLPEPWRNRGRVSAGELRRMRIQALKRR